MDKLQKDIAKSGEGKREWDMTLHHILGLEESLAKIKEGNANNLAIISQGVLSEWIVSLTCSTKRLIFE